MEAVQISRYGGPEVLEVNDIDPPVPGDNQVLVKVNFAGLNPFDSKLRSGLFKKMIPLHFPHTLGGDFAGIVKKTGKKVLGFTVGDGVYGTANILSGGSGSLAQYLIAQSDKIAKKPSSLDFAESAAVVLTGVSALRAIEEHISLKAGQKILIHGGAGGIGHIAVQLAKAKNAFVAVTVNKFDMEFIKKLGADKIIDYKIKKFEEILKDFDAVFDTVGKDIADRSFPVLKKGGVLVSMVVQPDGKLAKKYGIKTYRQQTAVNSRQLNRLTEILNSGKIKVNVDRIFSIDKIGQAYKYLEEGHQKGKVVVNIR